MANTIKGLTVEIGGDTTKLGKALEDVNKKSKDLSSELGQINKLLKLDPGNTELLAQKQKVLAEAISNTGKKLDTLKTAEKQVQEQFKKGKVSEEQVRALQREIIDTEKKMDSYTKAAEDVEKSLRGVGDESGKAGKDVDKFDDEVKEAKDSSEGLGKVLSGAASAGLKAVAAAATAALTGLVAAAESTREYRTEMGKLDTAFTTNGHSSEAATDTYKELQGILGETDQAVEAANHLAKLTKSEEELSTWTNIATGVYGTFGASLPIEGLTEAANETAKTGALTGSLADALNWAGVSEDDFQSKLDACSSEQERQTLIMETLNGLYSDAADKYRETNAEVIRANEANEAWMSSLAGVGGAIEPIITDVKMMGASLLSDLVPGVEQLAESFRGVLSGDLDAASGIGEALSGIITQVLDKVVNLLPTVVNVGVSLITTLVSTLVSMIPQLVTTGVDIITALLNGITTALPQITQTITGMIPQLVNAIVTGIPQLIQGAVQLLMAIVQAIPQILPPLVEALPSICLSIINGLIAQLPTLLEGSVQFLMAIVQAIPVMIESLVMQVPTIVNTIIQGLITMLPALLDGAVQLLQAVLQAIPIIIEQLIPIIPSIVNTVITGLIQLLPILLDGAVQLLMAIVNAIPIIIESLIPMVPTIVDTVISGLLQMLPVLLKGAVQLLTAIIEAIPLILPPLISALPDIIMSITSTLLQNLPLLIKTAVQLFMALVQAIPQVLGSIVSGVGEIGTAILDYFKKLPTKMLTIGKDLVKGLWNGIKDMASWVKSKISGFASDVLDGIKGFFGINSPSKETAWMGEMLDKGLAEGVLDHAKEPIKAMQKVTNGVLGATDVGGIGFERQLSGAGTPGTSFSTAGVDNASLLAKLEDIYQRLGNLQVVLDSGALVGGTIDKIDAGLAMRQTLHARGV